MAVKATKYTGISEAVKLAVWERDRGCCVICGNPEAGPHCHYIPRSQGGLGIEENIWSGCSKCHALYDQGYRYQREDIRSKLQSHFRYHYPDWDETKLIYRKGEY